MTTQYNAVPQTMMKSALQHLQAAIELLDQAEAPGQIAAHVDLAMHQLASTLEIDLEAMQGVIPEQDYQRLATS